MHTQRTTIILIAVAVVVAVRLLMLVRRKRPSSAATSRPDRAPLIKNRRFRLLSSLTVASMKMYFRNTTGLFFTLFIPLVLVSVFGLIANGNGNGSIKLTITDYANDSLSHSYISAVKKVSAFSITQESEGAARDSLGKGNTDLEVVIPKSFGTAGRGGLASADIQTYYNEARPSNGQEASLILSQIASGFNNSITHTPTVIGLKSTGVKTNNLGYIDFILPGIMAMSIMQLGIFTVAFAFISYKTSGALRRIQATPIKPGNFLIAQSITRYIVGIFQVSLLAGIGIGFFHLHLLGNVLSLFVVVTLGIIVFLAMGFGIAGAAKDENQAAPFANLIQFPQLFLSGIFFPRDDFPHWLTVVTNYLPLTYLSDAMRLIFNQGANLWTVRTDVLGLLAWLVIAYFIADRLFSWE
jgi:ABC-2 type transport system permease protein